MANDRAGEIMRHFDVVAESLHSEIRSVAEGHGMLAEGQKRIEFGQQVLTDRVTGLETGQQALVGSVKRLEVGQQVLTDRVTGLETGQQALVGSVKRLEVGQQVLTDRVSGLETGQQVLAERVKGLDAGLQTLTVGFFGLGDELKAFRAEVAVEFSELRSMVKFSYAELDRRIRTLEGAVVALTDRMDRLESGRS